MARKERQKKWQAWQQTLFKVGLLGPSIHQAEDSPNLSVLKELIEADEKPDSSVCSVGAKMSMNPFSDGSKTGEALHEDRSESTNPKLVICLDIWCITDEVSTQAEVEKYITIGLIQLPRQFQNDLDKQAFPEITFKICGINGKCTREFLVWSEVKQVLYCLPCWHTTRT